MPDRCCVPGCKSNYDKSGEYVSVFKFPKELEQKQFWIKKIPRKDWKPSLRSVVCEKHFEESDIVRTDEIPDRNGIVIKAPRKYPKLKEQAYPCKFQNLPKYLTVEKSFARTSRTEKLSKLDDITFQKFLKNDEISDFMDFSMKIHSKINEFNVSFKPVVVKNAGELFLLNLNLVSAPTVHFSMKINNNMCISLFFDGMPVPISNFKKILNDECNVLKRWSELENILSVLINMEQNDFDTACPNNKEQSINYWKQNILSDEVYDKNAFILEQMKLFDKPKMARRYSNELLIFSYTLYMKSSACYHLLYNSGLLTIPSADHLYKITSILKLDSSLNRANSRDYMSQKCNKLNDEDKVVNLLIDEYFSSRTTF